MKLMVYVYTRYLIQESNILFRKPPLLGPPLSLPDMLLFIILYYTISCYHIYEGVMVLLTGILLPRIARQGTVCLISIRG